MSDRVIKVKVTAGAKNEKVEETRKDEYKVWASVPPEKGKANDRVAELLAEHLKISKSQVFLKSGATYKEKLFLISM